MTGGRDEKKTEDEDRKTRPNTHAEDKEQAEKITRNT